MLDVNKYDAIVVGAGLSGSVVARELAQKNLMVLVIDRRGHIGGNVYDSVNDKGILVHNYGPHIFHTSNDKVYDYISKYSKWVKYGLKCATEINGDLYEVPFDFCTVDNFFVNDDSASVKKALLEEYNNCDNVSILDLLRSKNTKINKLGHFLYEQDYKPYTEKQWSANILEISPEVLSRVPIRLGYSKSYFNDKYECLPEDSYTTFVGNILKHNNIDVILNIDVNDYLNVDIDGHKICIGKNTYRGKIIYTGAIDELFGFIYGKLPYRSLLFEWKTVHEKNHQEYPVITFPSKAKYTRITEYTKLPIQEDTDYTTYAIEYPTFYKKGISEPYYPILTENNIKLYQKYARLAKTFDQLVLCGRLATFSYINMDQAIENALKIADLIR